MKCNSCMVKKCETRDLLQRHKDPMLSGVIERNCSEFEAPKGDPKQRKLRGGVSNDP